MGPTILAAAALATPVAPVQELPFWGHLEPGPHAVGFASRWEHDVARVYDTTLADGARYAAEGKTPRPVLVNLWYPARLDGAAAPERMVHGDYLELPAPDAGSGSRLAALSLALADYARDVIGEWAIGRAPDAFEEWDHAELERLLETPVACVRDAPPAAGRFPLVIYHSGYGSSFEDNSVLCEYLASHGYVVAGSAFQDETGESFNIDGKRGSARDFSFLIRTLANEENVDWHAVAVAGHSGGAHAALTFQAEPMAAVDAVVSLDTTQDYVSALDPHWLHPREMLDAVDHQTAPLLVVAGPHAFFQVCDALVHADRYYLTFRDLDHNDYTSQGIQAAEVAARRAAARSAADAGELASRVTVVRRGFEQCCEYVRLFLDAHLKRDPAAVEELASRHRETLLGSSDPHVEHVPPGADGPQPYDPESGVAPSPRQLFEWIATDGADAALELLERFRDETPDAPVFRSQLAYALLWDLVARGRADQAVVLVPFFRQLHPDLVETYLWWVDRPGDRYRDFRLHALAVAEMLDPEHAGVRERLTKLQGGEAR